MQLIPSKTFIAGEYLALNGGPSLIALTQPYFEFSATPSRQWGIPFHPLSPSSLLLNEFADQLTPHTFTFHDPHQRNGGFGASGAQFIGTYRWLANQLNWSFTKEGLRAHYLDLIKAQQQQASGADILAQQQYGCCLWQADPYRYDGYAWPFVELSFGLIRTGISLATHEHLHHLPLPDLSALQQVVTPLLDAFVQHETENFIDGINQLRQQLQREHLVLPQTQRLCEQLLTYPGVVAAKGCGALGAEVILVLFWRKQLTLLNQTLAAMGYCFVATDAELTQTVQES